MDRSLIKKCLYDNGLDKELSIRHRRQIFTFIFEDWIKLVTMPPIMPRARGMTPPISRVPVISHLDTSIPRLVKGSIFLAFPESPQGAHETTDPSYSASSKPTLIIEINPSVSGLCFKGLDQDRIPEKFSQDFNLASGSSASSLACSAW